MMNILKNTFVTLGLCFCLVFIPNCRGNIIATEEELADYGWVMYEEYEFLDARDWFGDAIKKDTLYNDSYNGMGWTMGHLRQADSSVHYFEKFLAMDSTFENNLDFYAGLSFAYNALGKNSEAKRNGNTFFGKQNTILNGNWEFSHNKKINYLDVRLTLAVSEFRLGEFDFCRESINKIYTVIEPSMLAIIAKEDYTTVSDISALATHLDSLQNQLRN
jgi:tetratricopeptide (TPR) repeat protein